MHLLMAIGGSSGCVAIPALVSAMRRRGWRVTPLPLAGSERFLTGDFLRELCAVDPLPARAAHPPVDAALIAPCPPLHPASRKTLRGRWLPELGAEVPLLLLPEWPTSEAALPACPERWSAAAPRTCLLLPQGPPPCRDATARLAPPDAVCETLAAATTPQDMREVPVLVTAGPTVEDIDPVRFLSNRSSGRMGVALALALWRRGACVTLVHGPLKDPIPRLPGLEAVAVRSARDMHAAVMDRAAAAAVAVMCAAVADYTPAHPCRSKIKKDSGTLSAIELTRTPDILAALGELRPRPYLVGFAAETEDLLRHAEAKLQRKNCDLICANTVGGPDSGFETETNRVTLLARQGDVVELPLLSKHEVGARIAAAIARSRRG